MRTQHSGNAYARAGPSPEKDTTVVGTLADTRKVLQALGVQVEGEKGAAALELGFAHIGHA